VSALSLVHSPYVTDLEISCIIVLILFNEIFDYQLLLSGRLGSTHRPYVTNMLTSLITVDQCQAGRVQRFRIHSPRAKSPWTRHIALF